jgi:hypothetical protein
MTILSISKLVALFASTIGTTMRGAIDDKRGMDMRKKADYLSVPFWVSLL